MLPFIIFSGALFKPSNKIFCRAFYKCHWSAARCGFRLLAGVAFPTRGPFLVPLGYFLSLLDRAAFKTDNSYRDFLPPY
jgi:hypothetical protein